jgi:hypothetical protein
MMSQYLVLIYADESKWAAAPPEQWAKMTEEHRVFGERHAGALRGGNALEPTVAATSLRRSASGELAITDGAFAETKEALGGYYVVEAADLDAAIAIASEVPALFGGVEVRPIHVMG